MVRAWHRLTVAALLGAGSVLPFVDGQTLVGSVMLACAVLMLLAWARYSDVPRASRAYNDRDRQRAFDLLGNVPFSGRLLAKEYRIYYHHVRARCLAYWERWDEAAREARAALGLRGIGTAAPDCHVVLAQALFHLGDREAAERHLQSAKDLPHNAAVDMGVARLERMLRPVPIEG